MIERVARALCKVEGEDPNGGGENSFLQKKYPNLRIPFTWETRIKEARAAITAMREPTQEMLKAFYGDVPVDQHLGQDWRDMIDAALLTSKED